MKNTELYQAAKSLIESIDEFYELHPEAIPTAEEFMDTYGDSGYYASIEQIRNILNEIDQENAIPKKNR